MWNEFFPVWTDFTLFELARQHNTSAAVKEVMHINIVTFPNATTLQFTCAFSAAAC